MFSTSYEEARDRFRAATAGVEHGAIEVVDGLTIDWAFTGDPDARRVLVFSSGLHGVEGYGGSAMQLEMLARGTGAATLWVHALNPWGMKHLRRVNENNVDLNRNFLAPGEVWAGADPGYVALEGLINPPSPPGFDFFLVKAAWNIARVGFAALKNAVAQGQYEYPKGLFYGGKEFQPGPRKALELFDRFLVGRERVVHVDLHSGQGKFAGRMLLLEGDPAPEQVARVEKAMGPVSRWEPGKAYTIRGGMTRELARRLAGTRYDALTLELGTLGDLDVIQALREENRLHHHGAPAPDHPAKRALVDAFAPAHHPAWAGAVIAHARALAEPCRRLLESE
ncbi:MAG: DUF2817 domain-containing protein [Myxococcota bacterium]